jgi:hypothetical protein
MRALLTTSDATGQVVIPGPFVAIRWIGRTLTGFAVFTPDRGLGLQQVLADDGMVYPLKCNESVEVTGLPAREAFWYVVANDEKEAFFLRPVPSALSTIGTNALLSDANAILTTDGGITLLDDT